MDGDRLDTVFHDVAALPVPHLASFLSAEAPQTAAALLLLFPHARAGEILTALPDEPRRRALRCMAGTRPADAQILTDVARVLRQELLDRPEPDAAPDRSLDVARIVEAMDPALRPAAQAAIDAPPLVLPAPSPRPTEAPPAAARAIPPAWETLINAERIEYDRLPMLEVVLDRFVRLLATSARNALDRPVEVGLERIRSVRFGDWLRAPDRPLLAVFRAETWDNYGLLAPDRDLLDSFGEAAMGGRAETAGLRVPDRAPTALDQLFAATLSRAVLADLGAAFDPVSPADFALDRLEENPRFACVTRPFNACLAAEVAVTLDGRPGRFELLLPYATLEPARDRLSRMFMGERFGKDPLWESHIRGELARARTMVRAEAGGTALPLGALLAWRPGTVFALDETGASATLVTVGLAIARGRFGRRGTRWAIALDRILIAEGAEPMTEPSAPEPVTLGSATATELPPERSALHKVKVRVSAVLGETEMTIEDVLRLGRGGVVELDRRVGELIDVYVNDRIVAKGELVVIDDRIGVSLSEIVPAEG